MSEGMDVRVIVEHENKGDGSFDIDYIRWDTTGAYEWKAPRNGLMFVIK